VQVTTSTDPSVPTDLEPSKRSPLHAVLVAGGITPPLVRVVIAVMVNAYRCSSMA
jgi:hypothetical protein